MAGTSRHWNLNSTELYQNSEWLSGSLVVMEVVRVCHNHLKQP